MPKTSINHSNLSERESMKDIILQYLSVECCGPWHLWVTVSEEAPVKYSAVVVGEIDIDDEETKSIVSKYQVNTVPTIVLMKDDSGLQDTKTFLNLKN